MPPPRRALLLALAALLAAALFAPAAAEFYLSKLKSSNSGGVRKKRKKSKRQKDPAPTEEADATAAPTPSSPVTSNSPVISTSSCFPPSATVQLASGARARMDALQVGDEVLVAPGEYSRVYAFTHRDADAAADFARITTARGAVLAATPGHYVYGRGGGLVRIAELRVGDVVCGGEGAEVRVERVERVRGVGLYNPQTLHGDIVVDGVRASTYTEAVDPVFAHAVLAPVRAVYRWFGVEVGGMDGGGGKAVEVLMPHGDGIY